MRSAKGLLSVIFSLTMALALATACSDDTSVKDSGVDGKVKPDAPPPVTGLDCKKNTCQDYVMDQILMPVTASDATKYALQFQGTPYNALGNILALLASQAPTLGLQESIDDATNEGQTIVLLRVEANSLTNQTGAKSQAWVGKEKVCCTSKDDSAKCAKEAKATCWNGSATFEPDPKSPKDMRFGGKISSGKMAFGPANMKLIIPLTDAGTLSLNLQYVNITGDITKGTIKNGILSGVIPKTDLDQNVIPEVAKMLNKTYQDPKTDATTVKMIKDLFDTGYIKNGKTVGDGDGKIETVEVAENPLIKTFLGGDVDVDNDGTKELSLGIGFSGVSCKINDSGTPTPDSGTTTPDKGTATPDKGTATPDKGTATPDKGTAKADAGSKG